MSEIKLSPKYGVNPTIPVCFWCGKERNEVALMGHIGDSSKHEDFEAPKHAVIDYKPCEECKQNMALGFTVIEATTEPNEVSSIEILRGVYPTGRYVVIKREAAKRVFGEASHDSDKAFLTAEPFAEMFK